MQQGSKAFSPLAQRLRSPSAFPLLKSEQQKAVR
nr:MAG TPA: hypothetical protein [Bacteriophage sp.]